ncbi:MAG: enoyl-CoA hydratase/isomerase family protein, partial [Desulfomonilaceae bacterium]
MKKTPLPLVNLESHEDFAIVRLANGVTNALSFNLVNELFESIAIVKKNFRGMVLAGGEKFFSIGFDIPTLLKLDRPSMGEFLQRFNQMVLNILTLPVPTVAAVKAHAVAGGSILLFSCDYRFAASGRVLIGLNGIKLGVPIPYLADLALRQIAGDQIASDMLYLGEFVGSSDAWEKGLVHDVFPAPEVEAKALDRVADLAKLPSKSFAAAKATRVEQIQARYEKNSIIRNKEFLDCWFSAEAQELLKEAAKK